MTISVRAQRRDLAILRALGAVRRQLLPMLHWEATLFALIVLLLGLPAGLVLGRWIVAQFTETLGVVSRVELYPVVFVLVALATLASANVLVFAPARRATRPSTDQLDGE